MAKLVINGVRIARPSKRLTLLRANFKLNSASIIYRSKGKTIEHQVSRINYLPTRQEIRLHTSQLQYPGEYEIKLDINGNTDSAEDIKIDQLTSISSSIK